MSRFIGDLDVWLAETAYYKPYWCDVEKRAKALESDGCSGVPDWFIWTCWEHDIHNRTHKFLCGCSITFKQAAYVFRVRIQQGSYFGRLSPLSWIRWVGILFLARKAWENHGE